MDLNQVWRLYRTGDVDRGVIAAQRLVDASPQHGPSWHALACCAERAGDFMRADRAFARASRASDEPCELPWRCPWRRFAQVVEGAVADLPPRLRAAAKEVTLVLADYAEPELLEDQPDSELLGLFTGPVRADRNQAGEISPRLFVFRRAHEHTCGTRKEFTEEVRTTLLHEFGHYLGYDEDDLERLGLE